MAFGFMLVSRMLVMLEMTSKLNLRRKEMLHEG